MLSIFAQVLVPILALLGAVAVGSSVFYATQSKRSTKRSARQLMADMMAQIEPRGVITPQVFTVTDHRLSMESRLLKPG
jgi:hypothetical protein